jgi:hypothetical protein
VGPPANITDRVLLRCSSGSPAPSKHAGGFARLLEDSLARAFERLSRISFERLPNLQAYEIRQPN